MKDLGNIMFVRTLLTSTAALLLLEGCVSNNTRDFRPDPFEVREVQSEVKEPVALGKVWMPEGDKNSLLCRLSGDVYLPNKMTFSQYIQKAFKSTLLLADRLDTSPNPKTSLDVKLLNVDFGSVSGQWEISGEVLLNGRSIGLVETVTEFGTAFTAYSACQNAADAFEIAVAEFVHQVLRKVSGV